jgi:hypothetical protein
MDLRQLTLASCTTCLAFAAATAHAAPANQDAVGERLEKMEAQLEALRHDGIALRRELSQLRAESGEHWLDERRAGEIRALVHDVLADADTRSSLLQDGLMAGWSPGRGFFLTSADNRFLLRIEGQMQVRWVYNYHDQPDRHIHGFENTRTRLAFGGHVFQPELEYYVRGEFARDRMSPESTAAGATRSPRGGMQLLEAYIRYHLNDEWSLRFGQFKLPFTREFLMSSARQLAVERSVVSDNLSMGWSQGIEGRYWSGPWRASLAFSDGAEQRHAGQAASAGAGAFQVATIDMTGPRNQAALTRDVEYALTGRVEHLLAGTWDQFGDFTSPMHESFGMLLGLAGHVQRSELGVPGSPRFLWYGYTVDASMEWGGANAFLAFTHHYIDNPTFNINVFGFVAQGGFYVTPKWEIFARYEFGDWDIQGPSGPDNPFLIDLHIITAGFNYYIDGHDAKWTTDIGVGLGRVADGWARSIGADRPAITSWRIDGQDADPQIVFRTQFQLLF